MNILYILLLSTASAFLYRAGGSDLKLPLKSKWRDWGCSLCALIMLPILNIHGEWWQYLLFFGLSWAFLSTYNDRWGTDDVEWYEWALTGFTYAMPILALGLDKSMLYKALIRGVILAVFMPLSNKLQFKVFSDKTDGVEMSRGFMYIITLLI